MNIEKQICTIEEGKRLRALGITLESYFYWIGDGKEVPCSVMTVGEGESVGKYWYDKRIPAYTLSELIAMIPAQIKALYNGLITWGISVRDTNIIDITVLGPPAVKTERIGQFHQGSLIHIYISWPDSPFHAFIHLIEFILANSNLTVQNINQGNYTL